MNRNQTVDLLTVIASFDKRTVGESDVAAWHAACKDLDFEATVHTAIEWFKDPRNQGQWFTPGHLRGTINTNGKGDIHERAQARRTDIADCIHCDDEGWINGTTNDGPFPPYQAVIRCDHTGNPLPEGFTPEPIHHGPRRPTTTRHGTDPQLGLPIAGADGEPVWTAYEQWGAIEIPCRTCGAQPREGCINTTTGTDRIIPCRARLADGYRATKQHTPT